MREEEADDMYIKTREFRMIWNKTFALEICEVWVKIGIYDAYAQNEPFCMVSGEKTVEKIYESFIMISVDRNIHTDIDIDNDIYTYTYSDANNDDDDD